MGIFAHIFRKSSMTRGEMRFCLSQVGFSHNNSQNKLLISYSFLDPLSDRVTCVQWNYFYSNSTHRKLPSAIKWYRRIDCPKSESRQTARETRKWEIYLLVPVLLRLAATQRRYPFSTLHHTNRFISTFGRRIIFAPVLIQFESNSRRPDLNVVCICLTSNKAILAKETFGFIAATIRGGIKQQRNQFFK